MAFKRISYMKSDGFASIIEGYDCTRFDCQFSSCYRLIYPRLSTMPSTASVTLGELLYDLLVERLGGWQKRDDKPSTYSLLSRFFRLRRKRPNIWLFWQIGQQLD